MARKYKCDECNDTGFVGDNGPGRGRCNHEYWPCDACNNAKNTEARLQLAAPVLLMALRQVEWVGRQGMAECPWCRRWRASGHAKDCARQYALERCGL
jgi:hypothetical protein